MSLIDRLKGAATGLGTQLKSAAQDQLRATMVPSLITAKSMEVLEIDKQLNKLGWSPESKQQRMELTARKTQLSLEIGELKAEHSRNVKASEEARKEWYRHL